MCSINKEWLKYWCLSYSWKITTATISNLLVTVNYLTIPMYTLTLSDSSNPTFLILSTSNTMDVGMVCLTSSALFSLQSYFSNTMIKNSTIILKNLKLITRFSQQAGSWLSSLVSLNLASFMNSGKFSFLNEINISSSISQ